MIVNRLQDPQVIRPMIKKIVARYFNGDAQTFSRWYHSFYISHERHDNENSPQGIVGSQIITANQALSLYKLQLKAIRKALHKPSIKVMLEDVANYLKNVSVPYDDQSDQIDIYHCALNAKRSLNNLVEMLPSDWCLANNHNVILVTLNDIFTIKMTLKHQASSFFMATELEAHYVGTHVNSIINKYSKYVNF